MVTSRTPEDCLAAGLAERAEDWPDAGVEVRRRDRRRARARHHRARRLRGTPLRGGARRAAAGRRRGPLPARAPGARPPRPRLTDGGRRAHTPSYGPFRQPAGPSSAPRGVPVGPSTPPKGLPVMPRLAASMHARATTPAGAETAGAIDSGSSLGQFLRAHQPLPLFVFFFGRASSENPSCSTASSTIG